MLKRILSIILGSITGVIIVMIGDALTHYIYPLPEGLDYSNKEILIEIMSYIPNTALIIMLAFWLISSFFGGFVAAKINPQSWKFSAIITSSILLGAASLNMFMLPHPLWMVVSAVILYIPSGYLGGKLAAPKLS